MKINPLGPTQSPDAQSKVGSNKAGQSESFSQVLKETVNEKADDVNQVAAAEMIPSLPISIDSDYQYIESMQRSIDHLEQYKDMLADPNANLRSMAPTVNKLKKDVNQLGQLMDGMTSEEQIQPLMNDTVELISREIARFEQGEYVD
jgi:hypothetical protein